MLIEYQARRHPARNKKAYRLASYVCGELEAVAGIGVDLSACYLGHILRIYIPLQKKNNELFKPPNNSFDFMKKSPEQEWLILFRG